MATDSDTLDEALVDDADTAASSYARTVRPNPKTDEESDYKAFAFGRVGTRPQMTLTVRFADGQGRAFPYAQLLGIDFDNDRSGFRIEFPGETIEVRGQNLERLLRYVSEYRAAQIKESTPQQSVAAAETAEIVDKIEIRRPVHRRSSSQST